MKTERNGKVEFIYKHEIFYTEYTQKVFYLAQCNFLDVLLECGFHLHRQTCVTHRGLGTGRDKHCIQEAFHLYMMLDICIRQRLSCQLFSQRTSFPFHRRSVNTNLLQKQYLYQKLNEN